MGEEYKVPPSLSNRFDIFGEKSREITYEISADRSKGGLPQGHFLGENAQNPIAPWWISTPGCWSYTCTIGKAHAKGVRLMTSPTESAAPTLILIHGATLNGRMWDPVRRDLDPRWRVVAPDLPGHGARRAEVYTLAGGVATVADAVRSVAPAPFVLVGDSLGGYTAQAAASSLPQDGLKGLVLGGSSTNIIGTAVWPFVLRTALFKVLLMLFGEDRLTRKSLSKALRDMGIRDDDAQAMIDAGLSLRAFSQAVTALRGIDFRTRLANVTQPVLLVNGSDDKVMVRQEPSFLAAAQRGSHHRFAKCGHGVSLLRHSEFAALVNDFASGLFPKPELATAPTTMLTSSPA
jgi:pimeloyl-ACP methyl ester carboxylesterase